MLKRRASLLLILALTACAHGTQFVPQDAGSAAPRGASDSVKALPGDSVKALPGDSVKALPGAVFGCTALLTADSGNCSVAVNSNISPQNASTPYTLLAGLKPADLQNRYALPSGNAGGLVAVVDAYDDPTAESDLAIYRATMGLPACTTSSGCFRKLNEAGSSTGYPLPNTGWSTEIALDLDMVSAACPNCKIALVEATSESLNDLGRSVDTAAALHPRAVSNSYYAPETPDESTFEPHYTHSGMIVTASSGDEPAAFYPAASPHVMAVGGTSLTGSSGAWNEQPWMSDGHGCSKYLTAPSWQHTACKTKSTVDVSAVADPQTGVAMFATSAGGWVVAGGTSVGAPLIAAAYALSNNPAYVSYPYGHRSGFYDVGLSGFDYPTGLGTPRGVGGL